MRRPFCFIAAVSVISVFAACATPPLAIAPWVHLPGVNLAQAVYYVSQSASGSALCDPQRRNEYQRLFERRFGVRVQILLARHEAIHGKDPEYIVVTGCRLVRASDEEQDKRQADAMLQFERWLTAAEMGEGLAPQSRLRGSGV